MARDESGLKSALVREIHRQLPQFVVLRHEEVRLGGVPDLSLSGNNKTSWWEAKHGTPNFQSKKLQEITLRRLDDTSYARYIIWMEAADGSNKRTYIVQPRYLKNTSEWRVWCHGYDHVFVVGFMKAVHGVG